MNFLKTHTTTTDRPDTYWVYWTNSTVRAKGVLKVRVTAQIADRAIAAELAAMQYLLEDKCVIGQKLAGHAHNQLIVSQGAIRKLQRRGSDKAHLAPYANFLTTRFVGCPLSVDKDTRWFAGIAPESVEELQVSEPRRETLRIAGCGEVAVTQHVLDRLAVRFLPEASANETTPLAWRKLVELATDQTVREVMRKGLRTGINQSRHGRQEGRYFMNPKCKLILVVTDHPREGKRLVTTYPATHHFHDIQKAA